MSAVRCALQLIRSDSSGLLITVPNESKGEYAAGFKATLEQK